MALPIAGVSEVGTAIIAHKSPTGMAAQSCIRGTWGEPCQKCWKCFRKELLSIALWGHNEVDILEMLHSSEVQIRLSAFPIIFSRGIAGIGTISQPKSVMPLRRVHQLMPRSLAATATMQPAAAIPQASIPKLRPSTLFPTAPRQASACTSGSTAPAPPNIRGRAVLS